jgi:hypothetical protein
MKDLKYFFKIFIILFIIVGTIKLFRELSNCNDFTFNEFLINNYELLIVITGIGALILAIINNLKNRKN